MGQTPRFKARGTQPTLQVQLRIATTIWLKILLHFESPGSWCFLVMCQDDTTESLLPQQKIFWILYLKRAGHQLVLQLGNNRKSVDYGNADAISYAEKGTVIPH